VKYEKAPSGESEDYTAVAGVVFENSYAATKTAVIFSGSKTLTGIRELKENDFSFQLKDATSGTVLATAKNNAKGIFTFDAIVYTAEGTYTYQLVEKDEGAKGITYDTTVYTLTVTVKDVDGQLQCTTVIKNGNEIAQSAGFTNVFTPDVAVATVSVQKELVNKTGKKIGLDGFTFQLEGNGQKQTFTTDADGKAELPLTFTAADAGKTYTYKLSEVAGSTKYMTYDSTVYEITVAITKGEDGQLQVAVQRDGAGAFRFVNTYNGAPPSTTPDTGDSTNVGLLITLALSSLACLVVLILSRKRTES
jgi:pilin isopeptide linkage protein